MARVSSASAAPVQVDAVVFDIGGVLVDANYRHLYRKLIDDESAMEEFLATVCTQEWHTRHDAGYPMEQGVADLVAQYPQHAALISAWHERFDETWAGAIEETVAIAADLKAAGIPLYLLSNWPGEFYPMAQQRFPFLQDHFAGQVISGYEGVTKPDSRIFAILTDRYGLVPATTVFIDDTDYNAVAAARLGFQAIRFTGAAHLRQDLIARGLPLEA
jgi:2-haloacid dehalogenase